MLPEEEQFFIDLLLMNPSRDILWEFNQMISNRNFPTSSENQELFFKLELWKPIITDLLSKANDQVVIDRLKELLINLENQKEPEQPFEKENPIKELLLYNWRLEVLPESIGKLTHLEYFAIYADPDNDTQIPLSSLPESIGNLTNLESLAIQLTEFNNLPESIGNLKKLKSLEIEWNGISNLPESIGKLKNLEYLALSANNLSNLPESIGNLKNLKELNLDFNQLESLPDSIGGLISLEMLDLSENMDLTCLPDSIIKLKNLKAIYLPEEVELTSEQEKFFDNIDED